MRKVNEVLALSESVNDEDKWLSNLNGFLRDWFGRVWALAIFKDTKRDINRRRILRIIFKM